MNIYIFIYLFIYIFIYLLVVIWVIIALLTHENPVMRVHEKTETVSYVR